jgi:hypothetical protein
MFEISSTYKGSTGCYVQILVRRADLQKLYKHFSQINLTGNYNSCMHRNLICPTTLNNMRFQVLTAASMKMTAFWDIVPCSLVEVDRRFRGPDDGGSTNLWNVGLFQRYYMALS